MSDSSSRSASRRQFLQQAGGVAGLTALTVAGCDSGGSSAPDPETVSFDFSNDFGVLNYAYALEQLEAAFYAEATANFYGDLNSVEGQYFQDLAAHEGLHRDFLAAAIPALGGELISDLEVDFNDVDFGNRSEVLATARLLEDTGVRAYKGQAPMLAGQDLLTPALQIHSVEARHAAEVRRLRATSQDADLKPWITGNQSGDAPPAVYAGEGNLTQAGIDQLSLGDYSEAEATEAYDEPLTMDDVAGENGIVPPFFA